MARKRAGEESIMGSARSAGSSLRLETFIRRLASGDNYLGGENSIRLEFEAHNYFADLLAAAWRTYTGLQFTGGLVECRAAIGMLTRLLNDVIQECEWEDDAKQAHPELYLKAMLCMLSVEHLGMASEALRGRAHVAYSAKFLAAHLQAQLAYHGVIHNDKASLVKMIDRIFSQQTNVA